MQKYCQNHTQVNCDEKNWRFSGSRDAVNYVRCLLQLPHLLHVAHQPLDSIRYFDSYFSTFLFFINKSVSLHRREALFSLTFQTFFKLDPEIKATVTPVVEFYQGLLLVLPAVQGVHCLARLWSPFKTNQFVIWDRDQFKPGIREATLRNRRCHAWRRSWKRVHLCPVCRSI